MYDINNLGYFIKQCRIKRKLSQEELAELIDVTPTHIKHIESGHRKPSATVLFDVLNALKIDISEISAFIGAEPTEKSSIIDLLNLCNKNEKQIVNDLLLSLINHRNNYN